MQVHLIDGTYELFRHFYGVPSHLNANGEEVAAVRGVVASMLGMLEDGVTHIGVATDHIIESFRNDMWPGYKTGEGIDPLLWAQFPILEEALSAFGIVIGGIVHGAVFISNSTVTIAPVTAVTRHGNALPIVLIAF